jgi:hypothetical protein
MGDAGLTSNSFAINYDIAAFMDNYLVMMTDAQDENGQLPDVVPYYRYGGDPADPSWSAAFPQNLWVRYAIDGDSFPAEQHWNSLRAYFQVSLSLLLLSAFHHTASRACMSTSPVATRCLATLLESGLSLVLRR